MWLVEVYPIEIFHSIIPQILLLSEVTDRLKQIEDTDFGSVPSVNSVV